MACIAKRRNRYVIDFYDTTGKRRWKTLPKGTTKAKAKESMREIEDQLVRGIWLPDKRVPTFKEVGQDWLNHKRANVRESTWEMYARHLRLHFGDLNNLKVNMFPVGEIEFQDFFKQSAPRRGVRPKALAQKCGAAAHQS